MSGALSSAAVDSALASRRHDLDALRAFAMLLGIALHAGLSLTAFPWVVQDTRQSEWFGLFFAVVHGFRMPLFFLVSGFFTAMLWRRRGIPALLKQRAMRIFLPCMLGLVTIAPAVTAVSGWAIVSGIKVPRADDATLVGAVRRGDQDAVRQRLDEGADVNAPDAGVGVPPLAWAAMRGDLGVAKLLVERGADVNARNRDGSTPLHGAAFLGRPEVAGLLIEKGADVRAVNDNRQTMLDVTKAEWELTQFIASLLAIPLGDKGEVEQGRVAVRALLAKQLPAYESETAGGQKAGRVRGWNRVQAAYHDFIESDRFEVKVGGGSFHLIKTNVFHHLWFLWFLCWLVPIFAAIAWAVDRWGGLEIPRWLILSPARFLWLVPLTLIPQSFMAIDQPSFGPDTSSGLVPAPHLLLFYGIFFGFGALYHGAGDDERRLGRWWWLLLPAALFLAFPAGLFTMGDRPTTDVAQVVYVWAMSFGMMGLFRKVLTRERGWIRYLSDASYWLYLTHLPLVIAAQVLIRDRDLPPLAKFLLICTGVTGFLLVVYQAMVRYTWIGRLLNGPRLRPASTIEPVTDSSLRSRPL
jgi:peptidoglycan/LPS O-acetylase OafA/YrhL